ncbi:MAG: adenosylmethionine--8-amino-7-oxononanoate transaminase [Candidatus Omnitrophica bacterium]|nr:adenosylmethionine--8-amino-7-oxononanoate transaminase [Candidatus Omnitrophota bacterium]
MPTQTLWEWDQAHVWHPFTPHSVYPNESPLMVVAGEGNYLIDSDGKRYLDGVSSIWCNTFGHRKKEIDEAIKAQLDRIAHSTFLGNSGDRAVELAHRLAEIAPEGLNKVFYSDNGSTAVEIAVKMALQFWQQQPDESQKKRNRFLAFGNAYHGDTVGSVSVGGIDLFHERFKPLLFEVIRSPSPYCYRCPLGKRPESCQTECFEEFEKLLEEKGSEVAAVVLEPGFQGASGLITLPKDFLTRVAQATQRSGALLILDEVAAGMGRSGKMFACETEGVIPDFLCIAKGLTGGYLPLAATLTHQRIFDAFLAPPEEGKTFFHGHTYTGNALGAAAAVATLDLFESEEILNRLPEKIEFLRGQLMRLKDLPGVGDIRQFGLAVGIELVMDRETREPYPSCERRAMRVCGHAVERGVFLRPLGDVVILMPPLSITEEEIKRLIDAVESGVRTCLSDAR